jgi:polar amino acid transport system substrate-binding protein
MSQSELNHPALGNGLPQWGHARTPIFASLTVLLTVAIAASSCGTKPTAAPVRTSAIERIEKARAIKCSYLIYSPYFRKDPNTGKLSGIFHDLMEEVGKNAGLKIEWVEEVGYENIFPGLNSDRYDVFAGGLWPNSTRAQAGFFTIPVFYSVIKAWGRPDDKRFVNNLSAINSPGVRIATIDGAMEDIIAKTDFPTAQRLSLPQLSPFTQNLLNITTGKADVTFAEPSIISEFLATNPGKLKELAPGQPLRVFGNSLVIKLGDIDLKEFLDVALRELLYSGSIDRILAKYEPAPNSFPRVAKPYELAPAR